MSRRVLVVAPRAVADGAVADSFGYLRSGSGDPLGLRRYMHAEDALVQCLMDLASAWGAEELRVRQPYLDRALPDWLPELHHDSRLAFADAAALLRRMLRGADGFGCRFALPGGDVVVGAGGDLCLLVEVTGGQEGCVRSVLQPELQVESVHDAVTDWLDELADEAFWAAAAELTDRAGRRLWVLESWAHGVYGERWYRADPSSLALVQERVRPHSLLTVGLVDLPTEHMALDRFCDRRTVSCLDMLDLRILPADSADRIGLLDVVPVREATIASGRIALAQPVTLFSPRKLFVAELLEPGEVVMQAVVPGADGASDALWPGADQAG
ncbi:MAG: hypothetical protein ACKVZ6_19365 [Kineosporiaceae bacterium]